MKVKPSKWHLIVAVAAFVAGALAVSVGATVQMVQGD